MSLRKELRRTRQAAFAVGTQKNLKTQWRAYLLFCRYFGFSPVPSTVNIICLYAQFLSFSVTSNSIRNYLNGVRVLHLYLGHEFTFLQHFIVRITLRGIARLLPHTPKQALAITVTTLLRVHSCLDFSSPYEIVVFTAALFAFFLMARLSNILPASQAAKDLRKALCRKHIRLIEGNLLVVFNWSKTIQFGERKLVVPLIPFPGSPICPVSLFNRMISSVPASPSSPAFVVPIRGGLKVLTKSAFINSFRHLLVRAGTPLAHAYTGHSFRRGGATWAFGIGIPGEYIQVVGDWKSECYKKYFEFSLDVMLSVSSRMRDSILNC